MTNRVVLDAAVRRFPAVLHRMRLAPTFGAPTDREHEAICTEYRLVLAEHNANRGGRLAALGAGPYSGKD